MLSLRHPCVVRLLGTTLVDGQRAIITEFLSRGSLAELIHDEAAPLPLPLRLRMALDVANGISYLHTRDPPIVHRDIKPQNLLLTEDLRVKVADLNIASLAPSGRCGVRPSNWIAPEVVQGMESGLPADVYSFGVVLWELFTRKMPWEGVHPMRLIFNVGRGDRLPVPPPGEHITPGIVQLIQDCFKEPGARPTIQQVVERLAAELGAVTPTPEGKDDN
eukprot:GAFH01003921.1.p2 GENE.GAFH01003921.1~~GAFH01003921.1.p2  ORF type:complete len:219 (-),score=48.34 GAFH01003921.1:5-661(-)